MSMLLNVCMFGCVYAHVLMCIMGCVGYVCVCVFVHICVCSNVCVFVCVCMRVCVWVWVGETASFRIHVVTCLHGQMCRTLF